MTTNAGHSYLCRQHGYTPIAGLLIFAKFHEQQVWESCHNVPTESLLVFPFTFS